MSTANVTTKAEPGIIHLTFALTAATTLAAAVLAVVAYFTMPVAIENTKIREKAARLELLPEAATFEAIEGHDHWFTGRDKAGKIVGYIVPAANKGYGGTIAINIGVDREMKILDYKIMSHNETPGLGEIAKKDKFRKQFEGRKSNQLDVTKRMEKGKIQAITGATITTVAVVDGIKEALEELEKIAQP